MAGQTFVIQPVHLLRTCSGRAENVIRTYRATHKEILACQLILVVIRADCGKNRLVGEYEVESTRLNTRPHAQLQITIVQMLFCCSIRLHDLRWQN